jgi:putative chitinase
MLTAKLFLKLPQSVTNELDDVIEQFHITNPYRLAHFLAQCAHESMNFKAVIENLNYSEEALLKVFPRYFSKDTAKSCARKPETIANIVYANRMGNGDRSSGDGWKYRGRGYIQVTGKINYKAFGEYIEKDILNNPNDISYKYPLTSAAWFFEKNNLWNICDKGIDEATIKEITKRINGGYNGLVDRIEKTNIFNKLLC